MEGIGETRAPYCHHSATPAKGMMGLKQTAVRIEDRAIPKHQRYEVKTRESRPTYDDSRVWMKTSRGGGGRRKTTTKDN